MKPILTPTNDGSLTLRLDAMDETYHSTNGALTEAQHVFIKNGFDMCELYDIRILEIGFGTGLNAIVTLDAFLKQDSKSQVIYTTIEKYPLSRDISSKLNYGALFTPALDEEYAALNSAKWEHSTELVPGFTLLKKEFDLISQELSGEYDLIYYDAFAPSKQEAMWEDDILKKVVDTMAANAVFVTYCAKGSVRRALQSFGLEMQRVPGPPGKREMLVGKKC